MYGRRKGYGWASADRRTRQAFPFQCRALEMNLGNDGRRRRFHRRPRPKKCRFGTVARATVFRKARAVRNWLDYTADWRKEVGTKERSTAESQPPALRQRPASPLAEVR